MGFANGYLSQTWILVYDMAVDQDEVSKVLAVLSHPLRREILSNLDEKGELSFTDIMNDIKVDTGKLSFHIRNLNGSIEQTEVGKYKLTRMGEHAISLLKVLKPGLKIPVLSEGHQMPALQT